MKYKELQALNREILRTREPGIRSKLIPVVNTLLPTQRYMIISSDPSSETNKRRPVLEKHSGFEERVLALFFYGSDDTDAVNRVRYFYPEYKSIFLSNFYWTHYSKVYADGNPGPFWAKQFLFREIALTQPKVIILFGGLVTRFLFGPGNFRERVNRILSWQGTPTICSLHPSRDWNMRRRTDFDFDSTWTLIRQTCAFNSDDRTRLEELAQKTSQITTLF